MKKAIFLMMFLLLAGCATNKTIWTKDNFSEEEFKRDNYQCVQESRTQWYGSGLAGMAISSSSAKAQANKLYKMCMESKGWRLLDASTTASPGFFVDPNSLITTKVIPNSPAEKAGIKRGDKIIEKNGQPVKCLDDIKRYGASKIGDKATFKMDRNGEIFIVELIYDFFD